MYAWLRERVVASLVLIAIVPLLCGIGFLLANASRHWARHWTAPQAVVGNVSDENLVAASTPAGADVIYSSAGGDLRIARLTGNGARLGSVVALHSTATDPTLARAGSFELAAWATDAGSGNGLRAVILRPGMAPRYLDVVPNRWSLEHPMAFVAGSNINLVYSWQRHGNFDVYLSRLGPGGLLGSPVRLTHASSYAFNPHAVTDADGTIQLVYMDICCGGQEWHMVHRRYSATGRPLGGPQVLDTIFDIGQVAGSNSSITVNQWALNVERDGREVWAAWMSNWGRGIDTAAWSGASTTLTPRLAVPGARTHTMSLAVRGLYRELVWQQDSGTGSLLATVQLGPDGKMAGDPDRVSYQAGSADSPAGFAGRAVPSVLWIASESGNPTRIEASRFSPTVLGPPSPWARLGLGQGNPVESLVLVLVSGIGLGLALAVANVLLIVALTLLYLVLARVIRRSWRWYLYLGALVVALYAIFVQPGAGMPLLLFLVHLHDGMALLAVGGMAIFIALLSRLVVWRVEDTFRAVLLAFAAIYFIAFLEALTFVQGGIGQA